MPLYRKPVAAAASGASYPIPGAIPATPKAGRFYVVPAWGTTTATTQAIATSSIYATGFTVMGIPRQPTSVNISVTTAATAGGTARAQLYSADDNLEPLSPLIDIGSVDTTTTGNKAFPGFSFPSAGNYALTVTAVTAGCTLRAYALNSTNAGFSVDPPTISGTGYRRDSVTVGAGAFPDPFATTVGQATVIRFVLGY